MLTNDFDPFAELIAAFDRTEPEEVLVPHQVAKLLIVNGYLPAAVEHRSSCQVFIPPTVMLPPVVISEVSGDLAALRHLHSLLLACGLPGLGG